MPVVPAFCVCLQHLPLCVFTAHAFVFVYSTYSCVSIVHAFLCVYSTCRCVWDTRSRGGTLVRAPPRPLPVGFRDQDVVGFLIKTLTAALALTPSCSHDDQRCSSRPKP